MQQRSELRRLFKESRNSAGSRALMSMMRELGHQIGRFKVRSLMKEVGLVSKQPGAHRYQVARSERPDIPNLLAREFDVQQPNQVWCGDITYVWAGGRWNYLAVVLDLYARRVVGWAMSDKPDAELAITAAGLPIRCAVSLRPRQPIWQPGISAAAVALSHDPEYESAWQLLG